MMENRREFLKLLGASAAVSPFWGCASFSGIGNGFDDELTVIISDTHVSKNGHQREFLQKVVNEILQLRPLPKRVVCLGDIAYLRGPVEDYQVSAPIFRKLTEAGIELAFALGNHDRRDSFAAVWPEHAKKTLVSGRMVSVVNLGACDMILLDTLHEVDATATEAERKRGWITQGQLKGEQLEWLKVQMAKRTRPFYIAAHHSIEDITDGDVKEINDLVVNCPLCIGWVHGHDHKWGQKFLQKRGRRWCDVAFNKRMVGVPSTGHWGDVGLVKLRVAPNKAIAECVLIDHFMITPAQRTIYDRDIVAEYQGAYFTFRW